VQVLLLLRVDTLDSITFMVKVSLPNYAMGTSLDCLTVGTTIQHAQDQVEFTAKGKLLQVWSNYRSIEHNTLLYWLYHRIGRLYM